MHSIFSELRKKINKMSMKFLLPPKFMKKENDPFILFCTFVQIAPLGKDV